MENNDKNQPHFKDSYIPSTEYLNHILDGYETTSQQILRKKKDLIGNKAWWKIIGKVRSRIIIRETSAYCYLIRRIHQPDLSCDRQKAQEFLRDTLQVEPFADYETDEILLTNVPYFFHIPSKKHLFSRNGDIYKNFFRKTALESLQENINSLSQSQIEQTCQEIEVALSK